MHHNRSTDPFARQLLAHPDDRERWAILADLLQRQGDPRGELIALDLALEAADAPLDPSTRETADRLRHVLAPRLLGPFADPGFSVPVRVTWRRGQVDAVRLDLRKSWTVANGGRTHHVVKLLFAQPGTRYLRRLDIRAPARGGMNELADALAIHPAPPLFELHVGDPPGARQRPTGSHEVGREPHLGLRWQLEWRMPSLLRAHPRLRFASLWGEVLRIPCRPGGKQERQAAVRAVRAGRCDLSAITTLGRALWDRSDAVALAAIEKCIELGPKAGPLAAPLCVMLRPPLGKTDPRPARVLEAIAEMGVAAAPAVEAIVFELDYYLNHRRGLEIVECLARLGPVARPALPRLRAIETHVWPGHTPGDYVQQVRKAARTAVERIGA